MKHLTLGLVMLPVLLIVALFLTGFFWWPVRWLNPNLHNFMVGGVFDAPLYLLALLGVSLAIVAAGYNLWRRRFAATDLVIAALFWWALLAPLTAAVMPGISYLFNWPLLAAGIVLLIATLRSGPAPTRPGTDMVAYILDTEAETASWVTTNDSRLGRGTRVQLDAWTRQFFPDGGAETTFAPWMGGAMGRGQPALAAEAPLVPLDASEFTLLAEEEAMDRQPGACKSRRRPKRWTSLSPLRQRRRSRPLP